MPSHNCYIQHIFKTTVRLWQTKQKWMGTCPFEHILNTNTMVTYFRGIRGKYVEIVCGNDWFSYLYSFVT